MEGILLHFDDEARVAAKLAPAADLRAAVIERHRFPDGELRLRLPAVLPPQVIVLRGLHEPNEKLVELLLAARTARALGARRITLVAPYLGYMRQDAAFRPGEAVSQRVVGGFLAELVDALVTVGPHLHRVLHLSDAVPVEQAVALSAAELLASVALAHRERPLLLGPDEEAAQWVEAGARAFGLDFAVCTKHRHGDHEVEIRLPEVDVSGRAVVILDDVASTGRTVARAATLLRAAGAASVDLAVTHALFAGDALATVRAAGVEQVWSTDAIAHETNVASVTALIAAALSRLAEHSDD